MLSTSPRVKINVTAIMKPIAVFSPTDHIIAFGNVADASLISSAVFGSLGSDTRLHARKELRLHMCTEQSYPSKALKGEASPIIADNPVVGQPPLFVKVKRTSYALPRGAKTHRGMIIAKRPVMWMMRTIPSINGNFVANDVLKIMEKLMAAMAKSVPCQDLYSYCSLFKMIRPWISVPTMNATLARKTCHPVAHSHPLCNCKRPDSSSACIPAYQHTNNITQRFLY